MSSRRRDAARQPTDIPRKHAISTMFVKNVRKTTVLPNQRMHASSKKRIRKLIRNSPPGACRGRTAGGFESSRRVQRPWAPPGRVGGHESGTSIRMTAAEPMSTAPRGIPTRWLLCAEKLFPIGRVQ